MILFDLKDTSCIPEIPGLNTALEFLHSCNADIPDGKVELDGRNVYAIIQSYNTKDEADSPRFEAHRKYIDIQFLLAGRELMGWAPLESLTITEPYDSDKDILFGTAPKSSSAFTSFTAGQAIMLSPADAHAPGLTSSNPCDVKKVVVKIPAN